MDIINVVDTFLFERYFFIHAVDVLRPVLDREVLDIGTLECVFDYGADRLYEVRVDEHLLGYHALEEGEVLRVERPEDGVLERIPQAPQPEMVRALKPLAISFLGKRDFFLLKAVEDLEKSQRRTFARSVEGAARAEEFPWMLERTQCSFLEGTGVFEV